MPRNKAPLEAFTDRQVLVLAARRAERQAQELRDLHAAGSAWQRAAQSATAAAAKITHDHLIELSIRLRTIARRAPLWTDRVRG